MHSLEPIEHAIEEERSTQLNARQKTVVTIYLVAPNNSGCTAGRSRAPVLPQLLSRPGGEIEMVRMFLS